MAPRAAASRVREVAIFRQNLFRISEPFIAQQAQQLQRYRPFYLGRRRYGAAPGGAESVALEDGGAWGSVPGIGWQIVSRSPAGYMQVLGARRPALIHAHFGIDGVYALPVARRLNVPLVTTFHGFDATLSTAALLSSPVWANYVFFRRQLARQGDLFLCVSEFVRERVLALGFPAARTQVHYTGVDHRAIPPRDPAEETPTVLHVARLVEMKGTDVLIRAFARVAAGHRQLRLVIIGDGKMRGALHALVRALGVQGQVQFLGALPHAEVMAWMRRAMMLVLPSIATATGRVEGLGMVLLEAAATGVPVIGSRIGGIPEGMIAGETGFLVPAGDDAALAARIAEVVETPAFRLRVLQAGPGFAAQRFDSRNQGARLEEFYDAVVARQPRGAALSRPI